MRRATERPGTRPAVHEHEGVPTWDGALKGDVGTEWLFDFDDGWQAVYHPSDPAAGVPFSRRGTLELHLPPAADPAAIAAHLERLNLQGRPVSREEAELTYLERNAWAQGLTGSAAYQQIHAASAARVAQLASTLAFQSADPLTPQEAILRAEREVGRQRCRGATRVAGEADAPARGRAGGRSPVSTRTRVGPGEGPGGRRRRALALDADGRRPAAAQRGGGRRRGVHPSRRHGQGDD